MSRAGNVSGPFEINELLRIYCGKKIQEKILVCREGSDVWESIQTISENIRQKRANRILIATTIALSCVVVASLIIFSSSTEPFVGSEKTELPRATKLEEGNQESEEARNAAKISELKAENSIVREENRRVLDSKGALDLQLAEEKRKNARAEKLIQALGQIAHDNLTKETKISRRPTKIDVRVIVDQSAEFGISESWVRGVVNPIIESSGYKLSNEFGEDAPWVFTVYIQSMPITKGVNSAYHIDVSLDAFCLLAKKVHPVPIYQSGVLGYAGVKSDYYSTIRISLDSSTREAIGKLSEIPVEPDSVKEAEQLSEIINEAGYELFPTSRQQSHGSGILLSNRHVLTNSHVVGIHKTVTIYTELSDANGIKALKLAADENLDLCVLELKEPVESELDLPNFASSSQLQLGKRVYGFGFPLVSLMGEGVKFTEGSISGEENENYIQISAPVQPGNSGGGLFLESGELCGVISATLAPSVVISSSNAIPQNANYSISIQAVRDFLYAHGLHSLVRENNEVGRQFSRDSARVLAVRIVAN